MKYEMHAGRRQPDLSKPAYGHVQLASPGDVMGPSGTYQRVVHGTVSVLRPCNMLPTHVLHAQPEVTPIQRLSPSANILL